MLRRVTLQLKSRSDLQVAAKSNGAKLSVADCRPMDRDTMVLLLEIEGDLEARQGTVSTIRGMKGVKGVHEVKNDPVKTDVLAVVEKSSICRASEKSALLCLDCPFDSTEVPARWEFVARSQSDVWRLLMKLKEEGIEAKPKKVTLLDSRKTGNKEKEIIALATEWGFFEYPRKITLKELSRLARVQPAKVKAIIEGAQLGS
jgi:predicted DNA binding protein